MVFLGIDDKEKREYLAEISSLKKELEDRDKRSESPKRAEKIKRRNRLKEGVRLLKADLARAQHLVMEANSLCDRLNREVHFSVTLRIPPERLGPTGKILNYRGPRNLWIFSLVEPESRLLCSAAIKLQRPGREDSIWALDKLEDRMSEMRSEIYSSEDVSELSFTTTPLGNAPPGAIANLKSDPFYEEQQQRFLSIIASYNINNEFLA